jgi:hypothetical protein
MKPITIKTDKAQQERLRDNPILIGVAVLQQLRDEGVPVVGHIWPMGVTSGELVTTYDETFEEITFTWRP